MNTSPSKDQFLEMERQLAGLFLLLGITRARVEFDGSGDSGQIDGVYFYKGDELFTPPSDATVKVFVSRGSDFDPKLQKWVPRPVTEETKTLAEALEHIVYEALNETGVDWYNNDGGFGHWEWTPQDGVEFEVNQREIIHNTAHYESGKLGHPKDEDEHEDKAEA